MVISKLMVDTEDIHTKHIVCKLSISFYELHMGAFQEGRVIRFNLSNSAALFSMFVLCKFELIRLIVSYHTAIRIKNVKNINQTF